MTRTMRKASRWFTDEAVNSKTNPFDPDSSEYEAWSLGNGFGEAKGRRLADRRWKRMVQTFRKDWKGVVVTCDDVADKLLRLDETARSKRGQRSAEIVAGEPKSLARQSGSSSKRVLVRTCGCCGQEYGTNKNCGSCRLKLGRRKG